MAQKEGYNLYIDKVLNLLLTNDNLMKLLYYNTPNALVQPNLTQQQKISLIYDKIYPYSFISNTVTTESSYLNMTFRNFRQISGNNPYFQAGKIMFFINCHKNLWKTDFGLRPLCILNEITKLFTNTSGLGIGKLEFDDSNEQWYDTTLGGYYIAYKVTDFNQNIG